MNYYAGIGARRTPQTMLDLMTRIAGIRVYDLGDAATEQRFRSRVARRP